MTVILGALASLVALAARFVWGMVVKTIARGERADVCEREREENTRDAASDGPFSPRGKFGAARRHDPPVPGAIACEGQSP